MKNDERVLKIGIASREEIQARTLAILRGEIKVTPDDPKVWFTSLESLAQLDFAHFWHFGCGAKPLKMLVSMGWHKTFLHVQALDLGPSNG
jgi:hypothetical protein